MKVIILGAGVVGFQIAGHLINEGREVTLIEKDPDRAKYVSSHLDCEVITAEGNNINLLKKAGMEKTDFFISVTNSDEINMISCALVNSEFTRPVKIARVRNVDYSSQKVFEKSFLGINYIVNSEVETARLIANIVALGANSEVMLFNNSDIQIRNMFVDESSFFTKKSIMQIKKAINENFLIAGIMRNDQVIIPSGSTLVEAGDDMYFLGSRNDMTRLFAKSGKKREKIDRILIVGGGKIGSLAAKYLIRAGRNITIVDENYENCKTLSAAHPKALILKADISDTDFFEDEKISSYNLIITATDNHELNVLTAAYGKSLGIKKAIALVGKNHYKTIASSLGIDTSVSPKDSTVNVILNFVKRDNIKNVQSLFGGKAEVIQYGLKENSGILNTRIRDISLPPDSLILNVIKNDKSVLPYGDMLLENGDLVTIITMTRTIRQIEELFMA